MFGFSVYRIIRLVQVEECRASIHEWLWGMLCAESEYTHVLAAQAHHQRREIGVAGHDTEGVEASAMEQIHCIDTIAISEAFLPRL